MSIAEDGGASSVSGGSAGGDSAGGAVSGGGNASAGASGYDKQRNPAMVVGFN